jgi:hypothetical protein
MATEPLDDEHGCRSETAIGRVEHDKVTIRRSAVSSERSSLRPDSARSCSTARTSSCDPLRIVEITGHDITLCRRGGGYSRQLPDENQWYVHCCVALHVVLVLLAGSR